MTEYLKVTSDVSLIFHNDDDMTPIQIVIDHNARCLSTFEAVHLRTALLEKFPLEIFPVSIWERE